ncbi:hypothetical protein QFC21_003038 [Naganishia friedmannii]|uniref:Uncharacterized protein n=1 Tax=Naganishia friedmannii TaxID=89922 RepID=A0ACC2VS39_9TREE|nr:hypothetical protein QFC21_003038 [Naganishia friedmannii]
MAKANKKTGAARKDKYYTLAKTQGYRARSAFKLIHLNRKYDLLGKSKVVIDLCAAPGGWLQVAEKYCPKQSLLVGVDLDPIRAIPNCTTFVDDITTASCRQQLRGHLKHFQADLVMHDGAPNVGTAWVQDAYTQSELVLQSLKLATEFLKKGGSFVTKVFRSGDYNSLMWVFNQLFSKVEATKPPSSRNVSAEIFVVCQDFLAPKSIDPKFLDPRHVFKEFAQSNAPLPVSILAEQDGKPRVTNPGASLALQGQAINVFAPEKKKRMREGYAEGDYTLFRSINVRDFILSPSIDDAMRVLSTCNAMTFDLSGSAPDAEQQKAWSESRRTTDDIKRDLADLKVLGKGDFKKLMKWRVNIRLEVGLDVKKKDEDDATDKVEIDEDVDEEQEVTEEMARLRAEAMTKAKRERRKANEKKARTIQRLHLNMTAPEDMTMEDDLALGGEDVFDLGQGEKEIKRRGGKAKTLDAALRDADGLDESEAEEEVAEEEEEFLDSEDEREARTARLEGALDGLYENYQERMKERDAKWKVKQARLRDRNQDAWHGVAQNSDDEDERIVKVQGHNAGEDDEEGSDAESEEGGWEHVAALKAKIGEEVDSSDEDSDSVMSDEDEDKPKVRKVRLALPGKSLPAGSGAATKKPKSLVANLGADVQKAELSMATQVWFDQSVFKGIGDLAALDEEESDDEHEEEEEAQAVSDVEMEDRKSANGDDFEVVPADPEEDGTEWDVEDEDQDVVKQEKIKKKGLLTGEAVTLASDLVNRRTTVSQMIDDGFNKHNFNHKDGLPTWFLDDEGKHWKANLPVTKEAMDALRAKQRALDARPIKKVAEAKARKKFKAHQRLEKAKKKAEGLVDAPDMSERDRATAMLKTLGKAGAKPKQKEVKVIVARGANRGLKGRPNGVKGRYKIVDARMRKEMRAMKRKDKATKKRKH